MERITIINPYIHQTAKLKKEKFLERIKNIQYLRANNLQRSFMAGEDIEWNFIEEIHKAINTGIFNFGLDYKIFAFEIGKDFYEWFKNNELQTIQKQIINWIAAVYLAKPNYQGFLKDYIYPPIFFEVQNVIEKHYSEKFFEKYQLLDDAEGIMKLISEYENQEVNDIEVENFFEKHSDEINTLYKTKEQEYQNASLSYINCYPPKFLKNPFGVEKTFEIDDIGLRYSPYIRVLIGYFTSEDWLFIVERDFEKVKNLYKMELSRRSMNDDDIKRLLKDSEKDSLKRAESNQEIFANWLYSYKNFEKTNDHIFKLFPDEVSLGLIYVIRQRNSNFFKIGWTEQRRGESENQTIEKRIAALQTGNPHPIDLEGYFKASGRKTEKSIHLYFYSKRKTGEWFLLDEKDLQNILSDDWRINNNLF